MRSVPSGRPVAPAPRPPRAAAGVRRHISETLHRDPRWLVAIEREAANPVELFLLASREVDETKFVLRGGGRCRLRRRSLSTAAASTTASVSASKHSRPDRS